MGRIHAFQAAKTASAAVESFRWETDSGGLIRWVEGVPRAALIGQSIPPAVFQPRAPFRDVPFFIPGSAAASGTWRVSGVPFFDPGQGHFLGYRGSARRDHGAQAAVTEPEPKPEPEPEREPKRPAGLFGTDLPPDALRQLIHELRTPLNAISGFAEMIEGQYLGPAEEAYRTRASRIRSHAGSLLSAVDDLDTAARAESSRLPEPGEGGVDLAALLYRLHEEHTSMGRDHAMLRLEFDSGLPLAEVDLEAAQRMLSRLLAAVLGFSAEGETLVARLSIAHIGEREMICTAMERPGSLRNLEEERLFDPAYIPDGDWPAAPALGLGFALRLVRNLAEVAGGSLTVDGDRFLLALPSVETN
ncbi:MAG TPA: HAMP domain-containing sensor histidine kinase [Allosphingosinicella sp.]|nr:HAMP domain-containing sensor histidine kinase [Allosphingosinicella sp.]